MEPTSQVPSDTRLKVAIWKLTENVFLGCHLLYLGLDAELVREKKSWNNGLYVLYKFPTLDKVLIILKASAIYIQKEKD